MDVLRLYLWSWLLVNQSMPRSNCVVQGRARAHAHYQTQSYHAIRPIGICLHQPDHTHVGILQGIDPWLVCAASWHTTHIQKTCPGVPDSIDLYVQVSIYLDPIQTQDYGTPCQHPSRSTNLLWSFLLHGIWHIPCG